MINKCDYYSLQEVISKDDFHALLIFLVNNQGVFSTSELIECLLILGEKFGKFYKIDELSSFERDKIYQIMVEKTDFENLRIIEDLIELLFSFQIDQYEIFLESHLQNITSINVFNEIHEALSEYKISKDL